jgi:RNA polymerase sigma factor (sigma-70 family)
MDNNELLQIKNGDPVYFRDFYSHYRADFIKWACNKFSCSAEVAQDIFQDALVILIRKVRNNELPEIRSSIKSLFWEIGKNLLINLVQRNKRFNECYQDIFRNGIQEENFSTDDGFDREYIKAILKKLLSKLSPPDRQLIELSVFDELPAKTIAVLLGFKDEAAVRKRKFMLLNKMKKWIIKIPALAGIMNKNKRT